MEALKEYLAKLDWNRVYKFVLSDNKNKEGQYRKVSAELKKDGFFIEKFTQKQAFHEKTDCTEAENFIYEMVGEGFRQINLWDDEYEYSVKITKKEKVLFNRKRNLSCAKCEESHNKVKKYLIPEGEIIPPLVDMGVFSKDGKVINSMYDKYRQINKFIEFIDDAVEKTGLKELNIIDFGCGKSYLTFVVYYYFTYIKKININVTGLDLKADVIEKCNAAAQKYGYDRLKFEVGDINGYKTDMKVDMVISLHACDTATDFALYNAVSWNAKIIISVPCCQHELCGQMKSDELGILERYGIIKERTAALMTDAVRGNLLEYCGYKTQLLEFIDFEHTPKNILIRAVKSNISVKHKAVMLDETDRLCRCFNFTPTLMELLEKNGYIKRNI